MLNRIVNINSNTGYKEQKGNFSSLKNLFRENDTPETGDKIELSPALKFLKKLEWTLKEVKVLEDKYYISFSSSGMDFYAFIDIAKISTGPYIDYKIRSLTSENALLTSDFPAMEIELRLSIAFYKKQHGFLGIIGKESSPENFSGSDLKDSLKKLNELFGKLFLVYAENAGYQSQKLNDLVEDSHDELKELTIINDLLILFLEKLTGMKISGRIITLNTNEPFIRINSVSLKNLP